jgi:hypothetical protein
MTRRRRHPTSRLVKQASGKRRQGDKEADAPATVSEHGGPQSSVLLPDHDGQFRAYDVSFFEELPGLREALTFGFVRWGANSAHNTRKARLGELGRGFVRFCVDTDRRAVELSQCDEAFGTAFVRWLNQQKSRKGELWSPNNRAQMLEAFGCMMSAAADHERFGGDAQNAANSLPQNPWPGRSSKRVPTPRLSRDHLKKIIEAAEAEVIEIRDRLRYGKRLLEAGEVARLENSIDYRGDFALCLAEVAAHYPGVVPDNNNIRTVSVRLANAVKIHGYEKIASYLQPAPRDFIPFAALLSVATVFNPNTLLSLNWSNVTRLERLGEPVVKIIGKKARALADPTVVLSMRETNGVGVALMLNCLEEMTARIRPFAARKEQDRLFLAVPRRGEKNVKGFHHEKGAGTDITWRRGLEEFCARHNLQWFSLRQIRTTVLDEVQLLTGDVLAAQAVGQQKSWATIWYHYTSDGTRKRQRERLGEVLMLRERWRTTSGLIDPRNRTLTPSMDRGAATPGFLCLDPFDSPRNNQTQGRPCSAYGECPSCPMAAIDIGDVAVVALLIALRRAIYASQTLIPPKSWLARWAPIVTDLDGLLAIVDDATLLKSHSISIPLEMV